MNQTHSTCTGPVQEFEDMAFYLGKLYAIAIDENVLIVIISQDPNTSDPQVARIGQVITGVPDPLHEAWWTTLVWLISHD